jgi:hypothetical protein
MDVLLHIIRSASPIHDRSAVEAVNPNAASSSPASLEDRKRADIVCAQSVAGYARSEVELLVSELRGDEDADLLRAVLLGDPLQTFGDSAPGFVDRGLSAGTSLLYLGGDYAALLYE